MRMASESDSALTGSAAASLVSSMSSLMMDTDLADFTVTCGDKTWKLHSTILAARSPFFKAAITNNMAEKLEMKIDIKELDPETMEEVINFMYGKPVKNAPVKFLFEASERFQMTELKVDVAKVAKQSMSVENVVELAQLAQLYDVEDLLSECADFIVKNDLYMKEDLSPVLVKMVFTTLKENLEEAKIEASRLKKELSMVIDCPNRERYFLGCTKRRCDSVFQSKSEVIDHIIKCHYD